MSTTRLSSKGQIILPKALRDAHHFQPGLEFAVEERPDGILLRPLSRAFAPTRVEDVLGCTGYRGRAKTIKEMEDAIARGVRESAGGDADDRD
ncbi:MAG: AbrB/MazE/SpoVT family DNA-binding domain-containing protein [Wenzhouxiangella sp.]|nr:MAG: AbrB/MazE/SpoVT family DNA-binding domain-containing protein [Wenzhouxiangella sp.]